MPEMARCPICDKVFALRDAYSSKRHRGHIMACCSEECAERMPGKRLQEPMRPSGGEA